MARDVAKWRISGHEALRRIENTGATLDSVARDAGVTAVTFSRRIAECGFVILRWPIEPEALSREYGFRPANRRILHVGELVKLQLAVEKRHHASVTVEHMCGLVGLPRSSAARVRDMIAAYRSDQAARKGGAYRRASQSEQWQLLSIQPLPGEPFSPVEVDPLRDDHRYQRHKTTSTGAARSRRPRKRLHINTAQMISRYKDGAGLREVADEAGTSPATVARRLREYGVPIRSVGRH